MNYLISFVTFSDKNKVRVIAEIFFNATLILNWKKDKQDGLNI